jgi:hypothetical protein
MLPEPCTDWGASSYLIGAMTGAVATILVAWLLSRKEV